MPLPLTVSCFSKIQIGFTFLVLAYPGSPGQRAVKRVCVCVCVSAITDDCWNGTECGCSVLFTSQHHCDMWTGKVATILYVYVCTQWCDTGCSSSPSMPFVHLLLSLVGITYSCQTRKIWKVSYYRNYCITHTRLTALLLHQFQPNFAQW